MLSARRRRQRETQTTQSRVQPGVEVMMTSGVYGTVVEVADDATIRLETSPGTVSRWDRRAVHRIISSPQQEPEVVPPPQAGVPVEPDPARPRSARPTNQDVAPPDRD